MPYIKLEDRFKYDKILEELKEILLNLPPEKLAGELNYLMTSIAHIATVGDSTKTNYRRFNEVMGVLESCKQELYRRQIIPYEDKKILENGDV